MVPLPGHHGINASWWRAQDCVAECGGDSLPGSCLESGAEVQFPEPVPGMSGLFSSWRWCEVPRSNKTAIGDAPDDNPCSHAAMIATNIVDQVQVPASLEPGRYLLSWRW